MSTTVLPYFVVFISGFFLFFRWRKFRRRSRGCPLPPSRKGLPFLGNALEIPTHYEWLVYAKWAKELDSDIFSLNAAGTVIIVVNSVEIINEMFEKRSTIYSSRPQSIMMNELVGWDWVISNLPYGEKWRERRRLFQQYFHPSNTASHQPQELEHVKKLLPKLLKNPDQFMEHVRQRVLTGGIAFSLAYGLTTRSSNDPYIRNAEEAIRTVSEVAIPGAFLVDAIPILKYVPAWMPGAGFQRKAKKWRVLGEQMRDQPFQDAEAQIASSSAQPSFMSVSLDNIDLQGNIPHQREVIRDAAGMVFAAASDTTTSALNTFILAMICFPHAQRRAQEELDAVLHGRLPEFSDQVDLPYVTATVKESLRWQVTTPIGVPHLSTEDDIYQDYFIPKGSIIIPNAWAMLHNEIDYPDPNEFKPERFLRDGKLDRKVRDPNTIAFGFGRRLCAGAHIAQSTLWLTAASLLTVFNFSKDIDSKGALIEPTLEYESGIISHPKPFRCIITPRSQDAGAMIASLDEAL